MNQETQHSETAENPGKEPLFVFPQWANYLLPTILVLGTLIGLTIPAMIVLGFSPARTDVGYSPIQPVAFSHAIHAGKLQMDCRYCHHTVEKAAFAAIPPTQTCMNCHASIKSDSALIAPVRESYAMGTAISWKQIHRLPDYAFFNHSSHVNKGVGCVSCHGRIDQMEVVRQEKTLSMSWCLGCHRAPEKFLRPRDQITNMTWEPVKATGKSQLELGLELKEQYRIQDPDYMTSCSTCHR